MQIINGDVARARRRRQEPVVLEVVGPRATRVLWTVRVETYLDESPSTPEGGSSSPRPSPRLGNSAYVRGWKGVSIMICPTDTQPLRSLTTRYRRRADWVLERKYATVTQASSLARHSIGPAVTMIAGRDVVPSTAPLGLGSHSVRRRTAGSRRKRAMNCLLGLCGVPGLIPRQTTVSRARSVSSKCSEICWRRVASNTASSVARSSA